MILSNGKQHIYKRWSKQLSFCLVIILFLVCNACNRNSTVNLSQLQLINLKGETKTIADYKGKTLFINFWATWCKPCIEEFEFIAKIKPQLEKEGMAFLFISDEPLETINAFKAKKGYNFDYLKADKTLVEYGVYIMPTTYLVNENGNYSGSMKGSYKWDTPGNLKLLRDFIK